MTAVTARNEFVETNGRRLAYRSIGTGKPIVLCVRFRGNMDVWDPQFLDGLAAAGFRVITFDYSGLGLSTGTANYDPIVLARDARDLIGALNLRDVVIGGWSLGGLAAQAVSPGHRPAATRREVRTSASPNARPIAASRCPSSSRLRFSATGRAIRSSPPTRSWRR